jgi:cytochrome c oxidase assembly protein subunit 16
MVNFRFPKIKYGSSNNPLRAAVQKHPFLLFGLPFITMIAGASFLVTPMTATRYEHHDKKFRRSERQEAIDSTGVKRRKFDAREEYYVSH